MGIFNWNITDDKPAGQRGGRTAEITEERKEILEAFQASIKGGKVDRGTGLLVGSSIEIVVPDQDGMEELKKLVGWAAVQEEMGYRFRLSSRQDNELRCVFWAVELVQRLYAECPECSKNVGVTEQKKLRTHGPKDDRCAGSGMDVEVTEE